MDFHQCDERANSLRYPRLGGRGLCMGVEKNSKPCFTKSQKNAQFNPSGARFVGLASYTGHEFQ